MFNTSESVLLFKNGNFLDVNLQMRQIDEEWLKKHKNYSVMISDEYFYYYPIKTSIKTKSKAIQFNNNSLEIDLPFTELHKAVAFLNGYTINCFFANDTLSEISNNSIISNAKTISTPFLEYVSSLKSSDYSTDKQVFSFNNKDLRLVEESETGSTYTEEQAIQFMSFSSSDYGFVKFINNKKSTNHLKTHIMLAMLIIITVFIGDYFRYKSAYATSEFNSKQLKKLYVLGNVRGKKDPYGQLLYMAGNVENQKNSPLLSDHLTSISSGIDLAKISIKKLSYHKKDIRINAVAKNKPYAEEVVKKLSSLSGINAAMEKIKESGSEIDFTVKVGVE